MAETKFGIIYFPSDSVKNAFGAWKKLVPENDEEIRGELERIEMEIERLQENVVACYIKSDGEILSASGRITKGLRDGDAVLFDIENGGQITRNIRRYR